MLGFSKDVFALDIGTQMTRIGKIGQGILMREPSVVALCNKTEIAAAGNEALALFSRSPTTVDLKYPIQNGRICDTRLFSAMIRKLFEKSVGCKNYGIGRKAVIAAPQSMTPVHYRAVCDAVRFCAAAEVVWMPAVLSAARGTDVYEKSQNGGAMLLDIGAGKSCAAIICFGAVCDSIDIDYGGMDIDRSICAYISRKTGVMIGRRMAETLKLQSCSNRENNTFEVCGRSVETGMPQTINVTSNEIMNATAKSMEPITRMVLDIFLKTTPELAGDIIDNGLTVVGGGSKLIGVGEALSELTGVKVIVDETCDDAVILGAMKLSEGHISNKDIKTYSKAAM